ncbi:MULTISPECIES: methyl-accepting chemotaxis protein [unclassified Butyrivibrio]|uniref:methyl-accepting chemotaxis protein n=1 Tax=unclassified Butyrivibrio TaxID=2639466 RepID=UPI0003B59208|nr:MULTISPECIES: methyl-accepting chemotaxis protein [unclassified Butyrivibrio]
MAKEKKANSSNIKFFDSIKTRLISVMMLVAIVPLIVAIIVSYVTSTKKATADAIDALDWQAWYIESSFETVIQKNITAMQAIAAAPSTKTFYINPNDLTAASKAQAYLNTIDAALGDGNISVLTGADGMQILRASGKLVDVSQREYFKQAMAGKTYVSDVITSASTGARQTTIATPVFADDGSVIGVVQRNYSMDALHEILAAEAEDAFVSDRVGMVAAMSAMEITPENEKDIDLSGSPFMSDSGESGMYQQTAGNGESIICWVRSSTTGWVIACAKSVKEIKSTATSAAGLVIIIGIILAIVAGIISFFMSRAFTEPIGEVNESLSALADGRFKPVKKHHDRKDEFGGMVRSTNTVIEKLEDIVSHIKASASDVGTSSEELSDMANQISQTAEDVSNAVQEIASGATQQADEIQSASENVGRIGDAVGDVQSSTGSLSSLADKMKEASEVSSTSLASLQDSSSEMTAKIDEISKTISATQDAVTNINDKVEGIASIATQTNLLSLNASIEAARAGEAGKGFAVVAEEIGKLADDSKAMADDIRKEMDILLEQSRAAVQAAEDVRQGNQDQQIALGETLNAVNGMLGDISSTVGGVQLISQGADTCESSKNAVVDTMSALSAISEENAASSEETGASMQELSATVTTLAGSANNLKEIAEQLNNEMEFFKS